MFSHSSLARHAGLFPWCVWVWVGVWCGWGDLNVHLATAGRTLKHRGHFEFRLCALGSSSETVTQACLDQNLLIRADDDTSTVSPKDPNYPHRYYPEPGCAAASTAGLYSSTLDGSTDHVGSLFGNAQKMRARYYYWRRHHF